MLIERILVTLVLLPFGLAAIWFGGIVFTVVVALIIGLAAWEYSHLFRLSGHQPAEAIVIGGAAALVLGRWYAGFETASWILTLLIFAAMTYHLVRYESGRNQAATDMAITISGALYFGWLGAYLVSLRNLPDGVWWFLLMLPTVWFVDTGAFFIGRTFGRRKLSPRLSPKKTWEGYWGGVATGVLGGALLALFIRQLSGVPAITALHGAVLGLALGLLTPLGDLGESMIKRQSGAKDASNLLPGHGGVFDRIDSWLWAAAIGYYIIVWLYL